MSPAVLETMLQKLYIMLVGNNVRGVFQTMCGTGDQTIVFKTKRETYTVLHFRLFQTPYSQIAGIFS